MTNTSFSTKLPTLQLAIDSTSLGEFKTCPRKYQYSIIEGWQPKETPVDLEFGIWVHKARERYEKVKSENPELTHDDTLDQILNLALTDTWNKELGRPWQSSHKTKTRQSLIQTIVWYLDEVAQNDSFETIQLANGKPAVELSFQFDSGYKTKLTGEPFILCGHLDRRARLGNLFYIIDIKTTASELNDRYFNSFSPDNQISLYYLADSVESSNPVNGIIIDAIQVGATFARFSRHIISRTQAQINEWYEDLEHWLRQMETYAQSHYWPMNDKSCHQYGGCPFRSACSHSPLDRQSWLKANFKTRVWDPLISRET